MAQGETASYVPFDELAHKPRLMVTVGLEAVEREAKRNRAALAMENAALCRQLRAAGIEPVSRSSDEWVALYERCMAVVRAASELVAYLGTSKEMLEDWT